MLAILVKPFHFKVFFSTKHVHGVVLDKLSNVVVASVNTNNHAFQQLLGLGSKNNDEKACELLGKLLARKMKERQVTSLYWDGIINQNSNRHKWHSQADAIWESIEDEDFEMMRDEAPSQKEIDDRRHAGRVAQRAARRKKYFGTSESYIDPRFRQQMWKLMTKSPAQKARERAAAAAKAETSMQ